MTFLLACEAALGRPTASGNAEFYRLLAGRARQAADRALATRWGRNGIVRCRVTCCYT